MAEQALTTNQAADRLSVKPRTVTRYIMRGLIRAKKWGRDYLIEPEELERFEQERRRVGRPAKGEEGS